jgi:hypothetical protein
MIPSDKIGELMDSIEGIISDYHTILKELEHNEASAQ